MTRFIGLFALLSGALFAVDFGLCGGSLPVVAYFLPGIVTGYAVADCIEETA